MTSFFSAIDNIVKPMESILRSTQKTADFLEKFRRNNERIANLYKDEIRGYLAQRGWFVAGTLVPSQYRALKKAIQQEKEAEIEDFMVRHVRSITEQTASETTAIWPSREKILADAFDAHSRELYTLSVPVMLAQADGIALEALGAFLFTNRYGEISAAAKQVIAGKTEHLPLAESFLGLLIETSGLRLPTQERDEQKGAGVSVSPLNRHGVLHGIDCDYPTECNSLRAIALIGYLNWVHEISSKK